MSSALAPGAAAAATSKATATATATPAAAATPGAVSDAASHGQRLYREGANRQGDVLRAQVGAGVDLQGAAVACARCHGHGGLGSREAGLRAPPLQWASLVRERPAQAGLLARPAYSEATLLRALREGLDASGRPLSSAMPRFVLGPREAADLLAYLKRLGTADDVQPGVQDSRITLGTVVPSGAGDHGRALVAGVQACLARANREGGVYGRQLELEVFESTAGAVDRRWAERSLMLVAPWFPAASAEVVAGQLGLLPVIGPLGLAAEIGAAGPAWFAVAPQRADQARVIVDRIADRLGDRTADRLLDRPINGLNDGLKDGLNEGSARRPPQSARTGRVWLLAASDGVSQAAAEALRDQAQAHPGLQLETLPWAGAQEAARALPADSQGLVAVVALLPAADLRALADALQQRDAAEPAVAQAPVYALAQQGALAALQWPAAVRERLRLTLATPTAEEFDARLYQADLQALGERPASPALQPLAYAAACAAVEALRQAGRALDPDAVVRGIEAVQRLRTGVVPPITFGPRQRHGLWESRLVRIGADGRGLETEGGWQSPRQAP